MKKMKMSIDLGEGGPENPVSMPPTEGEKKYYQTLRITEKEPLDLPEEGHAMIKFKKVSSSEEDHGNGKHYHCVLELQELISVHSEDDMSPTKKHSKEAEDSLDKLAKEKMKSKAKEDEYDDVY